MTACASPASRRGKRARSVNATAFPWMTRPGAKSAPRLASSESRPSGSISWLEGWNAQVRCQGVELREHRGAERNALAPTPLRAQALRVARGKRRSRGVGSFLGARFRQKLAHCRAERCGLGEAPHIEREHEMPEVAR